MQALAQVRRASLLTSEWGAAGSILLGLGFWFGGPAIIDLMAKDASVQAGGHAPTAGAVASGGGSSGALDYSAWERMAEVRMAGRRDFRAALARQFAEDNPPGHLLVGAARAQRVGAGKIDDVDGMARGGGEQAGFSLDRDAGIVGDLLPEIGRAHV